MGKARAVISSTTLDWRQVSSGIPLGSIMWPVLLSNIHQQGRWWSRVQTQQVCVWYRTGRNSWQPIWLCFHSEGPQQDGRFDWGESQSSKRWKWQVLSLIWDRITPGMSVSHWWDNAGGILHFRAPQSKKDTDLLEQAQRGAGEFLMRTGWESWDCSFSRREGSERISATRINIWWKGMKVREQHSFL